MTQAYDPEKTWEENADVLCTTVEINFAEGGGCQLGMVKLGEIEKRLSEMMRFTKDLD